MTVAGVRKAVARVFRGVADRLDPPPLRGDNRPIAYAAAARWTVNR